ncbi:MAG: winged helix DNA-binding domain-containing protein [Nocardioides sp.]
MTGLRLVSDVERRSRLARRHALTASSRVTSPEQVTRAMTVLHSTEPATVYLSCWARTEQMTVDDVDRALYVDRSLVKQLAMRRTLFVFPKDLLPAVWGSASARVAGTEGARMAKDVVAAGVSQDGVAWLDRARHLVLDALADEPDGLGAVQIRERVPELAVRVGGGSVWGVSRVLTHLGATADVVRAVNTGHWRTSRPRWTLMRHWLDEAPEPWPAADGYRELVRRWLETFGPGTENDIVWWFGSTKTIVRAALAELGAVAVDLEGGALGWVLPDDVDDEPAVEPWVALLPVLDPTVMGWKERSFYLGEHAAQLFDTNGNAGTTVWVDGRVVGAWVQDESGVVQVRLLEPATARVQTALDAEAARLTQWLDGTVVKTVYPSPLMRAPSSLTP